MREEELKNNGKIVGNMPGPLTIGGYAALGQLTFFAVVGIIIFTFIHYLHSKFRDERRGTQK
jgi:hypothetical protein